VAGMLQYSEKVDLDYTVTNCYDNIANCAICGQVDGVNNCTMCMDGYSMVNVTGHNGTAT
jgi:recombinational DNA repair protein RecR